MAIDISSEQVVTFTEATSHLPQRRRGKRPNVATLYRWSNEGIRGIRLEYLMIGSTRCTSVQAMQRFFDELTVASEAQSAPVPPPMPKHREERIEAAEARLKRPRVGVGRSCRPPQS